MIWLAFLMIFCGIDFCEKLRVAEIQLIVLVATPEDCFGTGRRTNTRSTSVFIAAAYFTQLFEASIFLAFGTAS